MTTPECSILMPVCDAAATLAVCLRSIARQSERRWECIVVDDGSRDDSLEIARGFAARDPRVRVLASEHRGIVGALNEGLNACRAPVVVRMDADDWMHHHRIEAQLACLAARPELAGLGAHVRLFPRRRLPAGHAFPSRTAKANGAGRRSYESWLNAIATPEDVRREAFVECPIAHPTLCIRRPVLERFGYRDRGWPEDYDLVLRLLRAGEELAVLPRRLLGWRDEPTRLSRTSAAYAQGQFTACKAEHLAAGILADEHEYVLWGYGDTGRALRRALLTHGRRPSHIVELHPGRLGQRIHGAPVLPPDEIPRLRGRKLVASVAGLEARTRIRAVLTRMELRETVDFVCAA